MYTAAFFALLILQISVSGNNERTDEVIAFFEKRSAQISVEEAACFGCVAILGEQSGLVTEHARRLMPEQKTSFYRQLVFLGASLNDRKVLDIVLRESGQDLDLIAWAVDCTSATCKFEYSISILNEWLSDSEAYELCGKRLLIASALADQIGSVDLSKLKLSVDIVNSIVSDESLGVRSANFKKSRGDRLRIGMSLPWAERLIAYRLFDAPNIPSEITIETILKEETNTDMKLATLFWHAASLIKSNDSGKASKFFATMQDLISDDKTVASAWIGELSFLASKLHDHDFIKHHLSTLAVDSKERRKAHHLLAAATECELDQDIFEFLSRAKTLTTNEINALAEFDGQTFVNRWEKVAYDDRIRIYARQIYRRNCSLIP